MSTQVFISLFTKAAKVQTEIEREQRRRIPDRFRLLRLKKLRLQLQDKINRHAHEEKLLRAQLIRKTA